MSRPVIGFAGMTHLGLVSAVASAAKGFSTVCFDADPSRIGALAAGQLGVVEPDLDATIAAHGGNLSFVDAPVALAACDLVYVAPDVATDDQGSSDLAAVESLLQTVKASVRPDSVIVILSQVPPGFTRRHAQGDARLFYQVETLIFGRAVARALKPERFMIGTADPGRNLPSAYAEFLAAFGCPILRMRYESAELAKIAINCFLVSSVSTTNTLAELCEKIGADWSEIAPALRLDGRIGPLAYLSPGLGIAGGNLERDLATLGRLGAGAGTDTGIVGSWLANSRRRRDWVLRILHETVLHREDPKIAVLGLAYKENTHSTKNSAALRLIRQLAPFQLSVFDPVVGADAVAFHGRVTVAGGPTEACRGADALCIMTPWPAFRELAPAAIAAVMAGRLVVDPYGVLDAEAARTCGLDHRVLGRSAAL